MQSKFRVFEVNAMIFLTIISALFCNMKIGQIMEKAEGRRQIILVVVLLWFLPKLLDCKNL